MGRLKRLALPRAQPAAAQPAASAAAPASDALPADKTGGFDGAKAYEHVAKIVAIGPRPPDSDGIHREQEYIHAQLKGFRLHCSRTMIFILRRRSAP